jgi:NTP pyrophosphatase (non-canonical NTP hydrolase)
MKSLVISYYSKRFGDNISSAYIHLVREIGEIALAIEKENPDHAKLKITEAAALLEFMASKYKIDLDSNMELLYSKKMDTLTRLGHR